jgi:L-galactono-1,4-lactone dehydrogenase
VSDNNTSSATMVATRHAIKAAARQRNGIRIGVREASATRTRASWVQEQYRFRYLSVLTDTSSSSSSSSSSSRWIPGIAGATAILAATALLSLSNSNQTTRLDASRHDQTQTNQQQQSHNNSNNDDPTTILNWSGTHAVHTHNFWEPETMKELEQLVEHCHMEGIPIRPLGSALSPNGIGFHSKGMVSLANMDKILDINKETMTVTVQAGARVRDVVNALRPHGLTLPNLASIAEQQMGGFVQVGAHGTGATIAPVDHYVTKLKLITPALGPIELTNETDPQLFQLAKVGLGCLGVVAEVTMQCIPAHNLVEHTYVLTRKEAREQLSHLLVTHKHVRYMWIPYADAVVVVTNDPEDSPVVHNVPRNQMENTNEVRFAPFRNLLVELSKTTRTTSTKSDEENGEQLQQQQLQQSAVTLESLHGMGFGELRDLLLAIDPLDVEHVKVVNEAEAEFWRKSHGYQTKPSDELLQFDCGGQQWVWEIAFPTGTLTENNGNDMTFVEQLLQGIEEQNIPAHSPIEQRWSASSSSLMSPVHGDVDDGGLHTWVGIIMYLPLADDERQRRAITERFTGEYCALMRQLGSDVNMASHWAKLEIPTNVWHLVDLQHHLKKRYPIRLFEKARRMLDPKDILGNPMINLAFGSNLKNLGEDLR